jgi:hypothetical protein
VTTRRSSGGKPRRPLDLDCDTLTTDRGDLRVVVYTAAPGSEAATKLQLLSVLGAQQATPR